LSLVGPSFSRVFSTADGTRVKHLVEPRLEWAYVSDPGDSSRIPVFDERDNVYVTNRMRTSLGNRIFVKAKDSGSREVVIFEIAQEHSLTDPLTPARGRLGASNSGPLSLWLRAIPAPSASVDARADIDPVTKNLRATSLSGGFYQGRANANLTWYTSFDPVQGTALSSQTRLFTGYAPRSAPWRLETHFAYDLRQQNLLEQRYVFRFRGSCWSAFVEVRDYRIEPNQTRDYRIAIDLTGLGTFLDIHGGLDSLGF
jgi:LPS-assembly protein